ncbi:MAG: bifunctional riboflavin kinase/FAD synthetase [Neisseria sp.]|nr:bifunctional riboflavin kinase/FAD synthetase [Neisseria sp.]
MQILFGGRLPPEIRPAALTIGNFDGVHKGHKHILQRLKGEASARGLFSMAVVFEPQPAEFFARANGGSPPPRLTPLRDKLRLLRESGCLDAVRVLRFNRDFSQMPAEAFIDTVLRRQSDARYLLVGDDFRFGCAREGGFDLLQAQQDFVTERTPSILVADERASSTAVRRALSAGRLREAELILGHGYVLSGRVVRGLQLGRTLGCPTANIRLPPLNYALNGVFVVEAAGGFGRRFGVASLGLNPTVGAGGRQKLEAHLFDFGGDLYGQRLFVRFLHKLRDEEKFANLASLGVQIKADMAAARDWLRQQAA